MVLSLHGRVASLAQREELRDHADVVLGRIALTACTSTGPFDRDDPGFIGRCVDLSVADLRRVRRRDT